MLPKLLARNAVPATNTAHSLRQQRRLKLINFDEWQADFAVRAQAGPDKSYNGLTFKR
jgi:hypothetical protein